VNARPAATELHVADEVGDVLLGLAFTFNPVGHVDQVREFCISTKLIRWSSSVLIRVVVPRCKTQELPKVKHNRFVNQLLIVDLVLSPMFAAGVQLANEGDTLPHLVGQYIIENRVVLLYQVTNGNGNLVLHEQCHKGFQNSLKEQLLDRFGLQKSLITDLHPYLQDLVFH